MVVGYHLGEFGISAPVFPAEPSDLAWPWLAGFTGSGWVGVQIFFVISGFVIAASVTGSTPSGFLIRRAIRVFPALWIYSCIALAIRMSWGEPAAEALPAFLRSAVLFPKGPYIDEIVWTLVVEAVFYIFIALLAASAGSRNQSTVLERGAYMLGAASAVFLCVSILSKHIPVTIGGVEASSVLGRYFFSVLLLRHGVFFAIGMLAWTASSTGVTPRIRGALAVFLVMGTVQIGQTCFESGSPMVLTIAIWLAALLVSCISLQSWRDVRNPRLAAALRELGLLTYPVYLGHFTIGMYLLPALAVPISNRLVLLAVLLAIVFGLAWLVLRGPERALQMMAKKTLLKPPLPVASDRLAR
jgi:peptidoglycan/LPS O-acetylase OafA/YrhL